MFPAVIFGLKGYLQFTQTAFLKKAQSFNALPSDLSGKHAVSLTNSNVKVITGANSGLGYVVALELSKRKAKVTLVCRSETSGTEAVKKIVDETGNKDVALELCDLSLPSSIKSLVSRLDCTKIDILVNNAGALLNTYKTSFAANTLGTYLLTELFLPHLQPSSRIITVSSGGMLTSRLNTDLKGGDTGEKGYDGVMAYSVQKRQQVELTKYWASQHPNLHVYSMHPGWTALPSFRENLGSSLRSSEQGADTIIWAACSSEVLELPSGSFLFDREVVEQHLPGCRTWLTGGGDVKNLVAELDEIIKRVVG